VVIRLGDSSLPTAPLQGGSFTISSVGTAVQQACEALHKHMLTAAASIDPEFATVTMDKVRFTESALVWGDRHLAFSDLVHASGVDALEAQVDAQPDKKREAFSTATHSAVFVEVEVDEDLGTVHVTRVVNAVAAGRVVNPKTARSQILGGVVWGIGMALHEETLTDHAFGRHMNHNLSEYHIPVQADVGQIDVVFVDEQDAVVNALGSKGVGEIGLVGVAAAISNAIYNATGKRVRDYPITLDKLLDGPVPALK
jgi:xanthine dehydrogenase YagR molybdenum-binding subunit